MINLEDIVEEFLDAHRQGMSPRIDDYVERYPSFEKDLRATLPVLAMFEEHKEEAGPDGSFGSEPIGREEVGDYKLIREIGRGGMGIVYEAKQKTLGRHVALKLLPARLTADESARKRFRREAKASAKLHHTNIVPVYEIGDDDGQYFFAMQQIEGCGLDDVIQSLQVIRESNNQSPLDGLRPNALRSHHLASALLSDRFTPRNLVDSSAVLSASGTKAASDSSSAHRIGRSSGRHRDRSHERGYHRCVAMLGLQVAEALAYAHSRGVIHRDIKPSNLLLDGSGVVWVSDFGLAKAEEDGLTQTGEFVGTVRYMSPERFKGICDASADIYGLGLTLYELLAFRPAYESHDRVELMSLITSTEPKSLRTIDRSIPKDLESIVSKAIEKDPNRRYQNAEAIAEDLQSYLAGRPIKARPISIFERLVRWSKRNRSQAALYLTIAATTLAVAIISPLALMRESSLRSEAEDARKIANVRATKINQNLYFAEMNLAGQAVSEPGGAGRVKELLSHWIPASENAKDLRGWEWHFLHSLSHREDVVITGPKESIWTSDFSPDGKSLVSVSNDRNLSIWNSLTGQLERTADAPTVGDVDWSPDGTTIASTNFGGRLQVRDSETLKVLIDFSKKPNKRVQRRPVRYSPDGKFIAWSNHEGKVAIANLQNQQITNSIPLGELLVTCMDWSPDSNRIAYASAGRIVMYDLKNKKTLWDENFDGDQFQSVCWSPDAKQIAVAGHKGKICVLDSESGKEEAVLKNNGSAVWKLSWGHHSQQLASAHADRTIRIWDIGTGRATQELNGHTDRIFSVQWDKTSNRLVSSGGDLSIRVWNMDSVDRTSMLPNANLIRSIDWHKDGTRLVLGCNTGKVMIWDLNDVSPANVIQAPTSKPYGTGDIFALDWSPDGEHVAWANHGYIHILQGEDKFEFDAHKGRIYALAWNPESDRIASCSKDRFLRIWNGTTGKQIQSLKGKRMFGLAWSPDGKLIALIEEDRVTIRDPATDKLVNTFQTDRRASSICWSPDSSQLVVASRDLKIKFWDVKNNVQIGDSLQTTGPVLSMSWSPDIAHPRLAASSGNGIVRIWDLESRKLALSMHIGGAMSVRWSSDGKRLAAAGGNAVFVWDATTSYLKDQTISEE